MHGPDEVGCSRVQLIVALVDEDAARVQHRPHRAVEDDDGFGVEQALEERRACRHVERSDS